MSPPTPPPIRACLFDMDGLLLDSEDLYSAAVNAVLHDFSRPSLPWSIKAQLQGRPGPEAGRIFSAWAQLPISHEEFLDRQSALQRQLFPTTKPLPGVEELMSRLASSGKGKAGARTRTEVALATSSHSKNFRLKTDHLRELFDLFPERQTVLGDDERIPKGRGKPCPDIYLLALGTVNEARKERGEDEIRPEECLVFEDSVPGVEAGRRAGMQVIWVPHQGLLGEYRGREKEVLAGRSGMVYDEMAKKGNLDDDMIKPPGEIDDGWGRMVETLEGFDYASYGIKA
ncbi:HAD-like protein [Myriangium duriaei CBS 260.36]|uniref:HAD-like protein n=1 Tax=Myriangium duriaei CBS 260.36 TaxID=1168546 RepID=A0A9P4J512_9PEZI|nr:HAD-like protein [Myriangium duriaei CBS 260.36]